MKRLPLAVVMASCASPPDAGTIEQADQRPPGVICAPSTWTPSATVPATGWCMWQPSLYMSPMPANLRACDARIPPQQGEVEIYNLPWVNGAPDASGASRCAVLNYSVGGYFDWSAFQLFGWQANDGTVIRALRIGPNTRIVFGDHPFTVQPQFAPSYCSYVPGVSNCVGTLSAGIPAVFPDVWNIVWGFKMASIWISRP